ncbi:MAG: tyrosine-type recombinase/integrase [Acutalibacteraceae bacterium]
MEDTAELLSQATFLYLKLKKTSEDGVVKGIKFKVTGTDYSKTDTTDENGNFTRPVNFRKRYYRILKAAGIETKGLHSLRHTFATNLVNGIKQPDGSIKSLTPRQVADLLGHTTSEITEMYYVKRDLTKLNGITDEFEL